MDQNYEWEGSALEQLFSWEHFLGEKDLCFRPHYTESNAKQTAYCWKGGVGIESPFWLVMLATASRLVCVEKNNGNIPQFSYPEDPNTKTQPHLHNVPA